MLKHVFTWLILLLTWPLERFDNFSLSQCHENLLRALKQINSWFCAGSIHSCLQLIKRLFSDASCCFVSWQVPGPHVLHLWHCVCLWLLLRLPAQPGHPGPLLQKAPGPGERHCDRRQQHLHHHPALHAVGPAGESGLTEHHACPMHIYVCADAGWVHLQAPAACQILQHPHRWLVLTHEPCLQLQYLEIFGISHLGLRYPCSPLWLLCALRSPSKFAFSTYFFFHLISQLNLISLNFKHTNLCLVCVAGYYHNTLRAKGQSDDE